MLDGLWKLLVSLFGLAILVFTGRRLIRDAAQAEARQDLADEAAADTIETRERMDDATRSPLPPDAARERLRRFASGARGAAETPPER